MKIFIKTTSKVSVLLCFFALFASCNLPIQDDFEFKDELGPEITFKDMTIWEWLQTQKTPPDSLATNGYRAYDYKYDLMIDAIQKTGLIGEYTQSETADRTYLMLLNSAFTGNNGILRNLSPDDVSEPTLDDVDVERLRQLLKYHIVTTKIKQVPTLYTYFTNYKFQTLIPEKNGVIYFQRDERYRITINDSPLLPEKHRSKGVTLHNYVFKNGIGHGITGYVSNVEF